MSNDLDVSVVAARPGLVTDRENTVEVLVRVQAPDAPKNGLPKRPPLNLSIVIDRCRQLIGQSSRFNSLSQTERLDASLRAS